MRSAVCLHHAACQQQDGDNAKNVSFLFGQATHTAIVTGLGCFGKLAPSISPLEPEEQALCFYVFLCQNAVLMRVFILGMGFRIWDLGVRFTSGRAMGRAPVVARVAAAGLATQPRSVPGPPSSDFGATGM